MHHHKPSHCLNCGHEISASDEFCSQCGQSTHTHRLNWHELIHELQHSIFHVDSGILFTIKELLLRPGYMVKDYLAGKRKRYFKPVLLVLILSTIYSLVAYKLMHIDTGMITINTAQPHTADADAAFKTIKKGLDKIDQIFKEKYGFVMLSLVPVVALCLNLMYIRVKKYHFVEYLFIALFLTAQSILLLLPLQILFFSIPALTPYNNWAFFIVFLGNLWLICQVFSEKSVVMNVIHFVLAYFFTAIIWTILTIQVSKI